MALVRITYTATLDAGEIPFNVIEKALAEDDGNFNIWDSASDVKVEDVNLEDVKK